ncbi:MAG TPA: DUF6580 family putative transport protein [Gammaproteobacteria bacterium]
MKVRLITLVSVVLGLALYRILPHPANFTPVMAMALFAGAQFDDRRAAFLLPLLAMLISDLVLGFHATMVFVYAAISIVVLLGMAVRRRYQTSSIAWAAACGSLIFFIITNFGAWLLSPELYSRDGAGLLAAYIAAIPFYQSSLLADAVFTSLLFGGWSVAERRFPRLVQSPS